MARARCVVAWYTLAPPRRKWLTGVNLAFNRRFIYLHIAPNVAGRLLRNFHFQIMEPWYVRGRVQCEVQWTHRVWRRNLERSSDCFPAWKMSPPLKRLASWKIANKKTVDVWCGMKAVRICRKNNVTTEFCPKWKWSAHLVSWVQCAASTTTISRWLPSRSGVAPV